MKIEPNVGYTIADLIDAKEKDFLKINHEYQRGAVWKEPQQQLLIDSIMRGYSVPAFYFHKKTQAISLTGTGVNTSLYIVDGQQRINAISKFAGDGFKLLDPAKEKGFQFPNFVKDKDCPWAGKSFSELSPELQKNFKGQEVIVYEITDGTDDEVRDLFIRLQAGTSLTAQERRDAWPGSFTNFVLSLGGKTGQDGTGKHVGHGFFTRLIKSKKESERRQIAAQIAMLFITWCDKKEVVDIKSQNIDGFYRAHVGFDELGEHARRLRKILDCIVDIMPPKPNLLAHEAIHIVLFVHSLMGNYADGWRNQLFGAVEKFRKECKKANITKKETKTITPYAQNYTILASSQSNQVSSITTRHVFFVQEMSNFMNLAKKDDKRDYDSMERESIYLRDHGKCQVCVMKKREDLVPNKIEDMEIHHVVPHSEGGETSFDNGALVHRSCHPKATDEVEQFKSWWNRYNVILPDEEL